MNKYKIAALQVQKAIARRKVEIGQLEEELIKLECLAEGVSMKAARTIARIESGKVESDTSHDINIKASKDTTEV